jgi:hypothetical protein
MAPGAGDRGGQRSTDSETLTVLGTAGTRANAHRSGWIPIPIEAHAQ